MVGLVRVTRDHERLVQNRGAPSDSDFQLPHIGDLDDISRADRRGPPPVETGALDALEFAKPSKGGFLSELDGIDAGAHPDEEGDAEERDDYEGASGSALATKPELAKEAADAVQHLFEIDLWLFGTIHAITQSFQKPVQSMAYISMLSHSC